MDNCVIRWPEIGRGRYGVDCQGRVYSNARGELKELKPAMTRCGYMAVFFCFGIKDKKRVSVHRVVASAFLDADSHRAHINHKNGNKADNRAENLEWVTPSENALHAIQLGLYRPNRMMTPEQKRKAISMRAAGLSFKQISESIGCSISTARSATLQAPEKQSHHLPADVELRDVERT